MYEPRRNSLASWLARWHRTIQVILYGMVALGVAFLILTLEAPMRPSWLAPSLLLIGLALLLLGGVPLLLLGTVRGFRLRLAERSAAPELQRWIDIRGWTRVDEFTSVEESEVRSMLLAEHRLCKALGLTPTFVEDPKTRNVPLLAMGLVDGRTAMTCTVKGLQPPEYRRRFMAVATREMPPIAVTDRSVDEIWRTSKHKLESIMFNERWHVHATNPRQASAMLQPRVMELFTDAPLAIERVDMTGRWAVAWLAADADAEDLDTALALVQGIAALLPRFIDEL